ncbi:hypothetical protein CDAR_595121 [Caerostris darwini]|uniref:Uncharacterized protein n=1 Tax=Caerostris darwini TaxID=1538125 RepID=A0AAV4P914_9ARAC|nr:hypothetical protein CDAR_595121 [Caerostris darwini]
MSSISQSKAVDNLHFFFSLPPVGIVTRRPRAIAAVSEWLKQSSTHFGELSHEYLDLQTSFLYARSTNLGLPLFSHAAFLTAHPPLGLPVHSPRAPRPEDRRETGHPPPHPTQLRVPTDQPGSGGTCTERQSRIPATGLQPARPLQPASCPLFFRQPARHFQPATTALFLQFGPQSTGQADQVLQHVHAEQQARIRSEQETVLRTRSECTGRVQFSTSSSSLK